MFAQTRYARGNVVRLVDFILNIKYDIKIEAAGITGTFPYDISIDYISFYDDTGAWMDIQNISFQFSPLFILKGRLQINEFKADSIQLNRLPQIKKTDKPSRPFSLPSLVYRIGLKSLNIARLSLGEDILGKPANFSIDAGLTEKEIGVKSRVFVNIKRTDGVTGSAFLDAEFEGAEPYLNINAGIDEPEKGLISALLGINTSLSMNLKGSGPINNWNGQLCINADQLADIEAVISMESLAHLYLDIEGTARLYQGLMPIPLNEFLHPQAKFKINAHIKSKEYLFLDDVVIESENAGFELNASLDIKHMTSEGVFKVDIKDIYPLGLPIQKALSGSLDLSGKFNGPFFLPAVNMNMKISDFKSDIIQSDEIIARTLIEFISADNSYAPSVHINSGGDILGLFAASLSGDLLEERLTWNLDMTHTQGGDLRINNLQFAGSLLSADISGFFNKELNNGNIEAQLKTDSLELYSGLLKMDIPQGISVSAKLNTEISGTSLDSYIIGKFDLPENSDNAIMNIIGPEMEFAGYIGISDSKIFKFSDIKINSDRLELAYSGSYDSNNREIHGLLAFESKNLAAFSTLIEKDIEGSARLDASIDGLIEMINMKAEATVEDLVFNKARFQNLSASIALSGKPSKNEGNISLSIKQNGYNLRGTSRFKVNNKIVTLENILFDNPWFNVTGDLSADMGKLLVQGELNGGFEDLSIFNAFFGREIQGSANLYLKSYFTSGKNGISLNIHGDNISDTLGRTDSLDIDLKLSGELDDPDIIASVSMLDFTNKNIHLKDVKINALGRPRDIDFTLTGMGNVIYDVIIETAGNISISYAEQSLTINRFQGEYGEFPVSLTRSFKVTRSIEITELEEMQLNIAGGNIAGYGRFSEKSVNFNMNFNDIPASLLELAGINQLEGNATGSVIISGTLKQPDANAQITINDIRLRDTKYTNLPSLNLSAEAFLQSERLEADLLLDSRTGEPFKLKMYLPVRLSLSPFSFSFSEDKTMNGSVSGELDLANITNLAGLYNQKIKGNMTIGFDIKGTIKSPDIKGQVRLEKGGYENYSIGLLITDITMDISSDSKRFVLNNISGTDGDEGKASGSGWFDFSPSKKFPYSLSLNLKNMALVRSNTTTMIASGKPTISGNLNNHTLAGKLTIEKGEYMIPEHLPAEITDLEVTEINGPEYVQPQDQKKSAYKSIMNMDISVESTGQVYCTGRGLNSEWKGDLVITGTTAEPIIIGSLSVLRGSYNLFGKHFELTEGQIDLDGRYPISPYLNVTGEAKTSEITAIINLTGDLRKPEITLSSVPSLPSDEILSQLLFGRDVSQITPLQAIKLGNALNTMMGRSRYDIIGSTKRMFGVDQLDISQSKENVNGSTVSVGKYLKDDLYIEVEKGLGTESHKASVTWEVTPNITVDTELHENSSTGVGVNWKWDY